MATEQKMSLISAVVAVGGLVVAILAHLLAGKAYKLAKAAEKRATHSSVVDRLVRLVYVKRAGIWSGNRNSIDCTRTSMKIRPIGLTSA